MRPVILRLLRQEAVSRGQWQELFCPCHKLKIRSIVLFIRYYATHEYWLLNYLLLFCRQTPIYRCIDGVVMVAMDVDMDVDRNVHSVCLWDVFPRYFDVVMQHQEDQALLKAYISSWKKFFSQCSYLPMPFHQLEQALLNKPPTNSTQKKGNNDESIVRKLMLDSWNASIFSNIKHRLQNSAMKLVHSERNGEAFDSQLVIGVRESYVNLCSNPVDRLQIYRENFEKAYLEATEAFYRTKAPEYLEANGVQSYMYWADMKLVEEEQRASRYLESYSGSVQTLLDCCVKVLITAFKEIIIAECPQMIKFNDTTKLNLMFRLMDRVPEGIVPMLEFLESHIIDQGLADMIASAEVITQDSEKYIEQLLELFRRFSLLV
ncbi:unnamed protein product, partial [Oppiella nova]